jgi:hypothetical protein
MKKRNRSLINCTTSKSESQEQSKPRKIRNKKPTGPPLPERLFFPPQWQTPIAVSAKSLREVDTSTRIGIASPPSFSIAFSVYWLSQAAPG